VCFSAHRVPSAFIETLEETHRDLIGWSLWHEKHGIMR
jgi:hypothetical protein